MLWHSIQAITAMPSVSGFSQAAPAKALFAAFGVEHFRAKDTGSRKENASKQKLWKVIS
jgi:hypothetical protein